MKKNVLLMLCASVMLTGCGSKKYAVSLAGEGLATLTKVTDGKDNFINPYGGDNGRNLFFATGENRSNIYKKDNPFSNAMNQKTSGENWNMAPTYCDAIGKIAFSGRQQGAYNRDIYMMNSEQGKALTQITDTPNADENYPCFSKDGKFIVYEKRQAGKSEARTEIWMKNMETGENLMLGSGRMPSFSPDGKEIVFVRYTDNGSNTCIWTMDANGDNQAQLTDAKMGNAWHPRFSPDGKQIIFDCYKRQKKDNDLYIIDRDGSNQTQLTINKSYDGQPYWTNDGYIYFVSDRGGSPGHYQIWRFKP